jgi:anti-anti-sigma factor
MSSDIVNKYEDFVIDRKEDMTILTINISRPSIKEVNEFKLTLEHILSYTDSKKVIVDFNACSFPDSVMLGAMVKAHKELQKNEGYLVAVAYPGKVRFLLGQTGLDRIIKIFDTKEEAIVSLKNKII